MRPTLVLAVVRHELRLRFGSPEGWAFLASFQVLAGLFFLLAIAGTGEASLRGALPNWAVTLVFCLPLVTMGQLAGEQRQGTLELLFTAPLPLGALIVGKWLSTVLLCLALLLLTAPIVATLWLYGDPDPGVIAVTYLGLWLCCMAFAAVGLFASSLTEEPMVAGVLGVLLLVPSWLAGQARTLAPEPWRPWIEQVSVVDHLSSFAVGVVDSGDIAWFLGVTVLFLFATWRSVEARRWA